VIARFFENQFLDAVTGEGQKALLWAQCRHSDAVCLISASDGQTLKDKVK
jgi:hypothetical protein